MASKYKDATQFPDKKREEFFNALNAWFAVRKEQADINERELKLRTFLADPKHFPDPVEGSTNKLLLGHGKALELDYRINRKLDESALDAAVMAGKLTPDNISAAIKYKAEVWASGYKKLDDETKKLFADIVTETPGTPGLKIVDAPKR